MSPKAKKTSEEISLPSFRDGIMFTPRPLNFGGFKRMGRAEANGDAPVDVMSVMIVETLKREFPNVTEKEIDAMEMNDTLRLTEVVSEANSGLKEEGDFTPPTSTDS